MTLRPGIKILFPDDITEERPLKFPQGNRTLQSDMGVADADDLPVPPPGPALNGDLLADLKGIRPKNGYLRHNSPHGPCQEQR